MSDLPPHLVVDVQALRRALRLLDCWPPQGSLLLQFKGDDAEAVLVVAKEFGAR